MCFYILAADVCEDLQKCKIKVSLKQGKPKTCYFSFFLLSSHLRSQLSMCVAQSISSKQLALVDPCGMVRHQHTHTHIYKHTLP